MADPGFPVGGGGGGGGADPLGGGCQPPMHTLLAKMYSKMKEIDPVGGGGHAPAAPPGSANGYGIIKTRRTYLERAFIQNGGIPYHVRNIKMLESLSCDKYREHCKVSPDNTLSLP